MWVSPHLFSFYDLILCYTFLINCYNNIFWNKIKYWIKTYFSHSDQRWKKNRRVISPAFNLTTLADYFLGSFNDQNEKLVQKLQKHCDSNELFDIWEYIDTASFSIICGRLFYHEILLNLLGKHIIFIELL